MNLVSFGQAFAATETASKGNDTTGHWAESILKQWQAEGLLNGYVDGSLKPNLKITRAEFAVLINKSFGFTNAGAITFKDVKPSDWFYNDIAKATSAGYITGYTDQTFKPNQPLTREEMAVIVASLLQLQKSSAPAAFTDTIAGHEWSKGQISAVVEAGIMVGYDHKFRPLANATRAEAVSLLSRALKLTKNQNTVVYDKAGNYGPETGVATVTGSVYINAPGVVLSNTIITGDLQIGEGVGKGDVTLKNVTVKGTTTISGGGKNSIHVVDSVLVTVIVNKQDGSIRIVTEGNSSVQQITLQSGALLEEGAGTGSGFGNVNLSGVIPANAQVSLAGTFETVDVLATAIQINLTSGSVQNLQVAPTAANTGIDISSGARLNALILNAISRITGQGTIAAATVNVSGSTFAQTPGNLIRGNNVSVTIGAPIIGSGSGSGSGSNPDTVTGVVYGFAGKIIDVNNQPLSNATIHFRKGLGVTTGTIDGTVVTDENGNYFANLSPGIYTGQIVKSGFITTYVVGVSLSTHKNTGQDATAIKIPAADEIRIVLTWNLKPWDEDSHLIGPAPNDTTFHTWYSDREFYYDYVLYADLDHDDTNSYGPETTTIRKRVDGVYTFYIENFSGNGINDADTLSASGGKVEIYNGDNSIPVKIYNVPVGDNKDMFWHVFNMTVDGSNLTFEDKNVLTSNKPGIVNHLPNYDAFSVENHIGAEDVVKVSQLSVGDIISVYTDEVGGTPIQSVPIQAGKDTATITGLNFGAPSTTIYISVTNSNGQESVRRRIPVLSEQDYTVLTTTIAGAFSDHEIPSTSTVGEAVYLANPLVPLPLDLEIKVLDLTPISSVTDSVYLYSNYSNVIFEGYNGTNESIQYKVKLELRSGYANVIKEFILTVPTAFAALQQTIVEAQALSAHVTNGTDLLTPLTRAETTLAQPNSTNQQYIMALHVLISAMRAATTQ
ncbi:S-layer homology domain-containing protein [Paenibacillus wynnii]|uniref:S-layer homology domain-containing protein n=1 Tax=Paenibacillus wynnii TaxID=268407 RepID=UPI0012FB4389|nr:S-layer homology domain-containing protein [Paenibacillus wynnii]